ncbi:MAG: hypothetical protein KAY02_05515 [Acidovorax sp.]|nr:hypothetical protein [Acidovorax sp.]
MSAADLSCPACGAELDLAVLFAHQADAQALARLVSVSVPLGARVLQYIALHTPTKQRLTAAKKIKLVLSLLPDLERQAITRAGRDWSVPLALWAQGIDQMLATRDAGRLDLPLKGHGYLYAVLQGLADKAEATAEQQAEAQRRTGVPSGTVTVRGQAMGIGAALATVYGGQDPTLAALDERDRKAAPMPEAVRQKMAEMGSKRSASN